MSETPTWNVQPGRIPSAHRSYALHARYRRRVTGKHQPSWRRAKHMSPELPLLALGGHKLEDKP